VAERFNDLYDKATAEGVCFAISAEAKRDLLPFINAVCTVFNFSLRQIESFLRKLMQLLLVSNQKQIKASWLQASVLLVATSFFSQEIYYKIGRAMITSAELWKFFGDLAFHKLGNEGNNYKRTILIILFGFCQTQENHESIITTLNQALGEGRNLAANDLAETYSEFGDINQKSAFEKLYHDLEKWKPFFL
jgi:hypothetical protein